MVATRVCVDVFLKGVFRASVSEVRAEQLARQGNMHEHTTCVTYRRLFSHCIC